MGETKSVHRIVAWNNRSYRFVLSLFPPLPSSKTLTSKFLPLIITFQDEIRVGRKREKLQEECTKGGVTPFTNLIYRRINSLETFLERIPFLSLLIDCRGARHVLTDYNRFQLLPTSSSPLLPAKISFFDDRSRRNAKKEDNGPLVL